MLFVSVKTIVGYAAVIVIFRERKQAWDKARKEADQASNQDSAKAKTVEVKPQEIVVDITKPTTQAPLPPKPLTHVQSKKRWEYLRQASEKLR